MVFVELAAVSEGHLPAREISESRTAPAVFVEQG
jgi:hypothetical protein